MGKNQSCRYSADLATNIAYSSTCLTITNSIFASIVAYNYVFGLFIVDNPQKSLCRRPRVSSDLLHLQHKVRKRKLCLAMPK